MIVLALTALIVGATTVAVAAIERAALKKSIEEEWTFEDSIVYGPLFLYGPLETADRD